MEFGKWLREKRISKSLTYQQVADAVGTSKSQVYEIETGKNVMFSLDMASRLAKAVGYRLSTALRQIGE